MEIKVIPSYIVDQIAAGEVVERPAAVVKELLENAIDAGATQIVVTIESGGVRLIEVSDNGSGIETEYIDTAFIRHATSKVRDEHDLNSITTLGFRGEALASIATVARVEVLTKTEQDEFASSYRIEGGQTLGLEVSARAVGTTMRVCDLFYNTPARMKFLKKDASEGTFVADIVGHVALSHPEISFKFVREGKLQYVTPGDGDLKSAAYATLGREFARDLVEVEGSSETYSVSGYVTKPRNCRASRSMQYFYINGRYVKNRTMMAALEGAYRGTLMHGKFPGCVLNLQMPADMVDVNIHPAKIEVRFAREKDVFDAVYRIVKAALAKSDGDARLFTLGETVPQKHQVTAAEVQAKTLPVCHKTATSVVAPSQAFGALTDNGTQPAYFVKSDASLNQHLDAVKVVHPTEPIPSRVQVHSPLLDAPAKGLESEYQAQVGDIVGMQPAFAPTKFNDCVLDISPDATDAIEDMLLGVVAATQEETKPPLQQEGVLPISEDSTQDNALCQASAIEQTLLVQETSESEISNEQTMLYATNEPMPLVYIGEVFKTYIIAQQGDVICMIDKHAAHERMLYEQLVASYGNVASQMLLEAVVVHLSAAEKQAMLENLELLEHAGLEIDDFGGTTVLVRAVPADIVVTDVENLTVELAAKLAGGSRDVLSEKTQWVLSSISCRAAIKAGDTDATQALMQLAQKILSGEIPAYCPHGRPCFITLTRKELEKKFGRIV